MKSDKPEFVYVTWIQSTPEKVWAALLDGEMTKDYWGLHRNVSDWREGSEWSHRDYETDVAHVTGKVIEAVAPKRLVLSWSSPGSGEAESRVTFEIEGQFGAVKLTVTHGDLVAGGKMWQGVTTGWPAILSSLKTMLETGKAMPMTMRRWGG